MKFIFINLILLLNLFSVEKKQITSLDELFGLWEITKTEPSTDSVINSLNSKKFSISKDRIQTLEKNSLLPENCENSGLNQKPNTLQKFSKYSQIKNLLKLKPDEKINLIQTNCSESPFAEFIFIPKLDSIAIYLKSKSDSLILGKKISKTAIFIPKAEVVKETVYQTVGVVPNQTQIVESTLQPFSFYYTDKAIDAIKQLESYRDYVYLDGNRNPIFGYGHLVPPHELEMMKEKYGYEYYDDANEQKYFQESSKKPSSEERLQIVETYLRQDCDIIIKNMKKNIKVPLTQFKIDSIVIYLFWRGSYANNKEVKEFYDLVNSKNDQSVASFMTDRVKKDSSGQDIPFLGGHYPRHRNTAKLYLNGSYHDNWLIDNL